MTSTFAAAFLASTLYVGLKATQQLNVVHDQFMLVIPTSVAMAACEVYVVAAIAKAGWDIGMILSVGLGAGIGCTISMWAHRKWRAIRTPDES